MAAHEAGVEVTCPGCGRIVMQKGMIPILGEGGQGMAYRCVACARAFISSVADAATDAATDAVADAVPAESGAEAAIEAGAEAVPADNPDGAAIQ